MRCYRLYYLSSLTSLKAQMESKGMPANFDKQWSLTDIANMFKKTTLNPNMVDLILHVVSRLRQQQLHACHAKMDSVTLLACLTLPVKYLVGLQPARCRTCETSNIVQWSGKSHCTHWTHWKSKGREELHGFAQNGVYHVVSSDYPKTLLLHGIDVRIGLCDVLYSS